MSSTPTASTSSATAWAAASPLRLGCVIPSASTAWSCSPRPWRGCDLELGPPGFARHVRDALPQAVHLALNGGHVPQLENPRETHRAMLRFLASGRID